MSEQFPYLSHIVGDESTSCDLRNTARIPVQKEIERVFARIAALEAERDVEKDRGDGLEAMVLRMADHIVWAADIVHGEGKKWEADGKHEVYLSFGLVSVAIRKGPEEALSRKDGG